MEPYRLYSDRLRDAAKAGTTDVYEYEFASPKLRVQVRQITAKMLGKATRYDRASGGWVLNPSAHLIRDAFCHEKGRDNFGFNSKSALEDMATFIENSSTEDFVDLVELICHHAETRLVEYGNLTRNWDITLKPHEAIKQINFRFRDAGFGFQYEGGQIVRIDSQFVHAEAVKPALTLLNQPGFEGPQAEFLLAHEHYRAGRNKEAITEAAKSFESMMKAVCDAKGWEYPSGSRASDLLKVLRSKRLWPDYLDGSFDQLLATLTSGLPKVRNEEGAHGQGSVPKIVPSYVAAYALHLAATKMVLIGEAAASPH